MKKKYILIKKKERIVYLELGNLAEFCLLKKLIVS